MGFLANIKQLLGIGTISVRLNVPEAIAKDATLLRGSIRLIGKSKQQIKSIEVRFEEEYITGSAENERSSTFTLGTWRDDTRFLMEKEELRIVDFEMPIDFHISTKQIGLISGLATRSISAHSQRSEYRIKTMVDVEGAKLDPQDFVVIHVH